MTFDQFELLTSICIMVPLEHVLPTVQIWQWVCTLPWGLRVLVGYDRELCALVVDTFVRELQRSYRWRAKCLFGLETNARAIVLVMRYSATDNRRLRAKMSTAILTLALPEVLYQRLEQAAAATKQSL